MNVNFNFEGYEIVVSDNHNNGLYKYAVDFDTVRFYFNGELCIDDDSHDREVSHNSGISLWLATKFGGDKAYTFREKLVSFMNSAMAKAEAEYESENELNRIFLELESMEIVPAFDVPSYNFKYGYDEFTWNGYYTAHHNYYVENYFGSCPAVPSPVYTEEKDNDRVAIVKARRDSRMAKAKVYANLNLRRFMHGFTVEPVFKTVHRLVDSKPVTTSKFCDYALPDLSPSFYKKFEVHNWLRMSAY